MYLKSIEVQGFKSFANKMKFQFHNGITAIVGPNGSGKSNIADAVRWVLGEQSARQLRGSNMQDVIFSGTENRKPLGFASVAITFDNSDHTLPASYSEVTVTRRLYRSGESAYLLNGTGCRLRDIQELFYDTGIGKEGYSIIGQGQIDKILSGKPEERRELFDEAAGIVKYKRRKLATQKKLESENANLMRVSDILSEIERQIGPLQRQSEKAKVYLQKKAEQKTLDIRMFCLEDLRTRAQLDTVEGHLAISEADLAKAKEDLARARREYEDAQAKLSACGAQIEQAQEAAHRQTMHAQKCEGQVALLQEQIRSDARSGQYFAERIAALDAQIAKKEEQTRQAQDASQKIGELLRAAQEAERSQAQKAEALSDQARALEASIRAGQDARVKYLHMRSDAQARRERVGTLAEQANIRKAEIAARLQTAQSEEATRKKARADLEAESAGLARSIADLQAENGRLEQAIGEQSKEMGQTGKDLDDAARAYHQEASRLESLRNLAERYDGYGASIRKVMEQRQSHGGLKGVVADLIRTEKKYETAIETALGGSIQNIVTDNEQTAKHMIDFLKKNRFGRATFLPLSALRPRDGLAHAKALYEPGTVGVASTLVDVAEEYGTLADYLLGQTLVVDGIDHAIAIAKKYRQSLRIVTLDGELLNPGGSMSGGAFKNSSNLLGRRREVEELQTRVRHLKEREQALRQKLEDLRKARGALRERLEAQTKRLQEQYLRQNTAKLKLDELLGQNAKNAQDHARLEKEMEQIAAQLKDLDAQTKRADGDLLAASDGLAAQEAQIEADQETLRAVREKEQAQAKQTAGAQAQVAELSQKAQFLAEDARRQKSEGEDLQKERGELLKSHHQSAQETADREEEIRGLQADIQNARAAAEGLQAQVAQLQEERQSLSDAHSGFFQEHEKLAGHLGELEKERFRLENQKERLEDYRARQVGYLWEEYGMTASEAQAAQDADAAAHGQQDISFSQVKKRIGELKNEIRSLGPVNVNAIEEYKEAAERHDFLRAQHDDLVKAGEALRAIIRELDEGMRRQFSEKFAKMQEAFDQSFRELFGGGKGTLELVEDGDMLEAGVRIIAQPPGKKLQNMMQLSGGEKALTAIALLFAIQSMKPSPFCLLDEIEAALDENNVARYAEYLKKLTAHTQFIMITHRRGTMAAADRLYGITMQEKGVSTQVSVSLVENELS